MQKDNPAETYFFRGKDPNSLLKNKLMERWYNKKLTVRLAIFKNTLGMDKIFP